MSSSIICRESGIVDDTWSDVRPASDNKLYVDVMVSPKNLISFQEIGAQNRWKWVVMIQDVQTLITGSSAQIPFSNLKSKQGYIYKYI